MIQKKRHAFLWIFLITIIALVSTTVVHEIGHVVLGWPSGCLGKQIVLDLSNFSVRTDVSCPYALETIVILGGLLLSMGFAMIFLTIKDLPEGDLFYVISGINLIIAYHDLGRIEPILAYASFVAGFTILMIGEIIYAGAYMNLDSRILGPLMKFRIYKEETI